MTDEANADEETKPETDENEAPAEEKDEQGDASETPAEGAN